MTIRCGGPRGQRVLEEMVLGWEFRKAGEEWSGAAELKAVKPPNSSK